MIIHIQVLACMYMCMRSFFPGGYYNKLSLSGALKHTKSICARRAIKFQMQRDAFIFCAAQTHQLNNLCARQQQSSAIRRESPHEAT